MTGLWGLRIKPGKREGGGFTDSFETGGGIGEGWDHIVTTGARDVQQGANLDPGRWSLIVCMNALVLPYHKTKTRYEETHQEMKQKDRRTEYLHCYRSSSMAGCKFFLLPRAGTPKNFRWKPAHYILFQTVKVIRIINATPWLVVGFMWHVFIGFPECGGVTQLRAHGGGGENKILRFLRALA